MREELISDGHRGRSRSITKVLVDWLFWGFINYFEVMVY